MTTQVRLLNLKKLNKIQKSGVIDNTLFFSLNETEMLIESRNNLLKQKIIRILEQIQLERLF